MNNGIYSIYGIIIILIITISIIVILIIISRLFKNQSAKISKNGIEIIGGDYCMNNPCNECKLSSILLKAFHNWDKKYDLRDTYYQKQLDYAEDQIKIIEKKVLAIFNFMKEKEKYNIEPKTYFLFTMSLKMIMEMFSKEIKREIHIFDYENASENEYIQFRRNTISKIPTMLRDNIPPVHILETEFFNKFMGAFQEAYMIEFAPVIENIADEIRRLALMKKKEQQKYEDEYEKLLQEYTRKKE